jgi:hypothetical protein
VFFHDEFFTIFDLFLKTSAEENMEQVDEKPKSGERSPRDPVRSPRTEKSQSAGTRRSTSPSSFVSARILKV